MLTHGAARANVYEIINIHHLRRKKWGGSSRPCRPASDGLGEEMKSQACRLVV